jgi:exportin-1
MKSMRAVKKETLKLIQTFIKNCQDSDKETVFNNFLPALMDPVLDDYNRNVPDARDAEVLALFGAIVAKLGGGMTNHIPRIFESTFQCTLDMINKNFTDYPDMRTAFFGLIREINTHCFPALLRLSGEPFQLVMNSIIWAVKHLERNIQDTGLTVLYDLLRNVETSEVANSFFKTFFSSLVQDLFGVLTDTFHKSGFRMQATILAKMFNIIESGAITVPLWNQGSFQNNQQYVRDYVSNLLASSNLSQTQIQKFVMGLFELNTNIQEFKNHLKDFLVQLKGFDSEDAAFLEEQKKAEEAAKQQQVMSVPGLLYTGPSSGIVTELGD